VARDRLDERAVEQFLIEMSFDGDDALRAVRLPGVALLQCPQMLLLGREPESFD
jgi:hypothetical protein